MSQCEDCTNKTCIKSGKPCKEIEGLLQKEGIFGRDWIRPMRSFKARGDGKGKFREVPFSAIKIFDNDKPPVNNGKKPNKNMDNQS